MEKNINDAIRSYMIEFKAEIIQKRSTMEVDEFNIFVAEKEPLVLSIQDFQKPLRVSPEQRCSATRSNGKQCTRKKQSGKSYCGTHLKTNEEACPLEQHPETVSEVLLENFDGIYYYVDQTGNVYKTEDIVHKNLSPFAKYTVLDGKFSFA